MATQNWMTQSFTRGNISISHFVLIALVILVLGSLVTHQFLAMSQQEVVERLQQQSEERLDLYESTLHSAVARYEYLPYLVATDKDVGGLLDSVVDSDLVNQKLKRWQEASGAAVLYVMNHKGRVVASSNMGTEHSFIGHDYHYRPYFLDALSGDQGRFFAIGATTGIPGFFLSHPIRRAGSIVGVAVVKLDLSELEANWLAGGEGVLVVDQDDVVFLASDARWKYKSLQRLSQATRQRLIAQRKYSGKQIGQLDIDKREIGERLQRVLDTYAEDFLLRSRHLEEVDGTLYYLASLTVLEEKSQNTVLNGMMLTLLVGLLVSLWLMRVNSHRQARLANLQLARSAVEQRQIIRETQAGLVTTDEQFEITFANPTAMAIFNTAAENFERTDLCQWLRKPGAAADSRMCAADFNAAQLLDAELEAVTEERIGVAVLVSSRPLVKSGEKGFLVTINDISELKAAESALREAHDELEQRVERRTLALNEEVRERSRAEKELRQTQKELIQAAKLAALGEMSAGIVHEINQPLAAIQTYLSSARLLLKRDQPKMADGSLEEIQGLVRRMNTLISHLKTFARRSEGQLQPVNLETVVENTLMLLQPRLKKMSVQPEINMPDTPIWVMGDDIRLEQILVNLMRNSLDVVDSELGQVVLELSNGDERVDVVVTDNGPGIAEEHLSRIFDPFFTTKEVGEGMGLGLSVSYGIAREMGGQLKAVNQPEGGARFQLSLLPATAREEER